MTSLKILKAQRLPPVSVTPVRASAPFSLGGHLIFFICFGLFCNWCVNFHAGASVSMSQRRHYHVLYIENDDVASPLKEILTKVTQPVIVNEF